MIDFLLKLLAGAAVVGAAIVGAIVIKGMITKAKLREAMRDQDVAAALVDRINRCDNTVKLVDLYSNNSIEVRGDGIASDIYVGEKIIA